jgi:hypothetical protein
MRAAARPSRGGPLGRGPAELAAIARAKARLDRLDWYPRPVDTARVRILHVPWLFRVPGMRAFDGFEIASMILLRQALAQTSEDLLVHELCHVWQEQRGALRMRASYLRHGYRDNPREVEARRAAAETRGPDDQRTSTAAG